VSLLLPSVRLVFLLLWSTAAATVIFSWIWSLVVVVVPCLALLQLGHQRIRHLVHCKAICHKQEQMAFHTPLDIDFIKEVLAHWLLEQMLALQQAVLAHI
jgi:hypothetical protein